MLLWGDARADMILLCHRWSVKSYFRLFFTACGVCLICTYGLNAVCVVAHIVSYDAYTDSLFSVSLDIDEIVSTLDVATLQGHLGCAAAPPSLITIRIRSMETLPSLS